MLGLWANRVSQLHHHQDFWILKSAESLIIIAIGIFPIKQENLFSFSFFNLARNLFFYFFFFFLLSLSHPTLAGVDDKTVKSVVRCSRAATARRLDSGVRVGCKCKTKQVLRAKLLAFSLLPPHDKYRKKLILLFRLYSTSLFLFHVV